MTENLSTPYPPPPPERVERALTEMRARRARRRRVRALAGSTALAVIIAGVAFALAGTHGSPQVRVVTPSSTSAPTTTSTTNAPATTTTTNRNPSTSTQPTTTAPSAPTTAVITYQPFTATGAIDPSLRVTADLSGTCVTGESNRTYRCFSEGPTGSIYDPCFAGPGGTTQPLVCPSDPTTGDVVQLAAASVTSEPPVGTTRPWAMQLANGRLCLFVSAAWGGLGPYGCRSANTAAQPADCRPPVEAQPEWTTTCQDDMTNASPFTTTRVVKVWF